MELKFLFVFRPYLETKMIPQPMEPNQPNAPACSRAQLHRQKLPWRQLNPSALWGQRQLGHQQNVTVLRRPRAHSRYPSTAQLRPKASKWTRAPPFPTTHRCPPQTPCWLHSPLPFSRCWTPTPSCLPLPPLHHHTTWSTTTSSAPATFLTWRPSSVHISLRMMSLRRCIRKPVGRKLTEPESTEQHNSLLVLSCRRTHGHTSTLNACYFSIFI